MTVVATRAIRRALSAGRLLGMGVIEVQDLTKRYGGTAVDAANGAWPRLLHVAVMLAWTIGAGVLAARVFRWE
jgi:hypothetical protein